ncbi:Malate dehydrogenase [Desulfurella amilsii]|uniref:Malate dehydrogenase n=1 Tax=Desulfurella amilsii TaxID=1562698 RepID=A0A1X4XWS7_9BACT|nr:malate dehydrogenase [Desulfurella amilsii]OSS41989.1 Malate dehydrogenase [Desulfurella amilsii]
MLANAKISVIGAGQVGATTAVRIAEKELTREVVLVDIVEGLPQGKALDEMEASPIEGFDTEIIGTNDYKDTENSDIVVITSGLPRKPGMSRDDLLSVNVKIVKEVTEQVAKYSPNSIIIVVTNPLDAMVYTASKVSGFADNKVIGQAGCLDSTRFKRFIAWEAGVSVKSVEAMTLGGHGDDMVPLVSYSTIRGVPISQFFTKEQIDRLVDRTRNGGGEIVKLLKTGSAFYATSSAVVQMIDSIVRDKKDVLPCAVKTQGKYGLEKDLFVGLPVKLGKSGIEEIVELKMSGEELKALKVSGDHVKELCKRVEELKLL